MSFRILLRHWLACLICCLPLLVLLLIPQLMRSRAGSGELLMVGTTLLLALLIAAFILAPEISARFAPARDGWEPGSALHSTRQLWRRRPGATSAALIVAVVIYAAGQLLGYALAELVPYVTENPGRLSDPDAAMWTIRYPAYALQALVLYISTTGAVAVYALRLRTLHLDLRGSAPASA